MDITRLQRTVDQLMDSSKGLIAMDESTATCNRRFAALEIPQTVEARRAYRELIVTTPNLNEFISGAILFDETVHQATSDGIPFLRILADTGIAAGIKVDKGLVDLAGCPREKITEGLDGMRDRLGTYVSLGLQFAKWRAVVNPNGVLPSEVAIEANAHALARYAAYCQEISIVPIVEMEVLMDGDETLERCALVTEQALHALFRQLVQQGAALEYLILKPNMVLPGLKSSAQPPVDTVAEATVRVLRRSVPAAVPGVAFLSGGQSSQLASARLNAINQRYSGEAPWRLTFSFSRALQSAALEKWSGRDENRLDAQKLIYHRAKCNSAASRGVYEPESELREISNGR
jgi:fructose-bisphosphate aldolase class I